MERWKIEAGKLGVGLQSTVSFKVFPPPSTVLVWIPAVSKRGSKSQRRHKSSRPRSGAKDSSAADSAVKGRSRLSLVRRQSSAMAASAPSADSAVGLTMLTVDVTVGQTKEEQRSRMFMELVISVVFSRMGRIMMLVMYSLFGALMFIMLEGTQKETEIVTPEGFLS